MQSLGSVVGVELYARDAVVVRSGGAPPPTEVTRGEVTMFSRKSRQRLAFVANNTTVEFRTIITLTYPKEYPHDGSLCKKHLREWLTQLQAYTGGADYLWFVEFQRRGAPHFHILTDYPMPRQRPLAKSFRLWVSRTWYTTCGELDPKHLVAGTNTQAIRNREHCGAYAVKYATKMEQKAVPPDYRNVGRFWGHTRAVAPQPMFTVECTEDDIRQALVGLPYAPPDDRELYKVLYNKAAALAIAGLDDTSDLDNDLDT